MGVYRLSAGSVVIMFVCFSRHQALQTLPKKSMHKFGLKMQVCINWADLLRKQDLLYKNKYICTMYASTFCEQIEEKSSFLFLTEFTLFCFFPQHTWIPPTNKSLQESSCYCSRQNLFPQSTICFGNKREVFYTNRYKFFVHWIHGLRTPGEDIAFTDRPKIHSHSQIFRYGRCIFCLPHRPKFSYFFDLCLHWVSVFRD